MARHIEFEDRQKIEALYGMADMKPRKIAKKLGFHFTTIYREIKRGLCQQRDSELRDYWTYLAETGQRYHDEQAALKGACLKIGHDHALMTYIEDKIVNDKFSPGAVLGHIREQGLQFQTTISHTTLYRYIDENMFIHLTNKHLPSGKRPSSKKKYKKVQRLSYNQPLQKSIRDRPKEIDERNEFGHWEMDTVVGKAKGKSTCLLVLTERMTRAEIVMKIAQKSAYHVVRAVDRIERQYKGVFSDVFKTITTDNGTEFSDVDGIEKRGRTVVYHCRPYSSWERGSNENANKLIRRFIPKGTNITQYTHKEIERIEHWINNYPRGILGYKCSRQLFDAELAKLM